MTNSSVGLAALGPPTIWKSVGLAALGPPTVWKCRSYRAAVQGNLSNPGDLNDEVRDMSQFQHEQPLVLVVDDEPSVLGEVAQVLTAAGYTCHCCSTAEAAWRKPSRTRPS